MLLPTKAQIIVRSSPGKSNCHLYLNNPKTSKSNIPKSEPMPFCLWIIISVKEVFSHPAIPSETIELASLPICPSMALCRFQILTSQSQLYIDVLIVISSSQATAPVLTHSFFIYPYDMPHIILRVLTPCSCLSNQLYLSTGHDKSSPYCLFLDNLYHFLYLLHGAQGPEQSLEQAHLSSNLSPPLPLLKAPSKKPTPQNNSLVSPNLFLHLSFSLISHLFSSFFFFFFNNAGNQAQDLVEQSTTGLHIQPLSPSLCYYYWLKCPSTFLSCKIYTQVAAPPPCYLSSIPSLVSWTYCHQIIFTMLINNKSPMSKTTLCLIVMLPGVCWLVLCQLDTGYSSLKRGNFN